MPIIPVLCTQCGARLKIDSETESVLCPFCGTSFILEKKADKYKSEADNLAESGDAFLSLKEYSSAREKFKMLTNKFPYDYRGWWGLAKTDSKNYTDIGISKSELNNILDLYNKASAMVSSQKKYEMQLQFEKYFAEVCDELSRTERTAHSRIGQLKKEHEHNKAVLEEKINVLAGQRKNRSKLPSKKLFVGFVFVCIVLLGIVANSSLNNLNGAQLSGILLVPGVIAYFVCRILGGKLDSDFIKRQNKLNEEIRLLQEQLAIEDRHYRDEMYSLDEQINKAVND